MSVKCFSLYECVYVYMSLLETDQIKKQIEQGKGHKQIGQKDRI